MPINNLQVGNASVVRKPRLSNQIYELIRGDLRSGKYAADTRFTEPGIARTLNTSRTPVREAIFQLVSNGLLSEYDRGYGLPKLSSENISQMMEIRIALESLIIRKLCQGLSKASLKKLDSAIAKEKKTVNKDGHEAFIDANNALRELLYELTENPYLQESAELYADRLQVFRVLTLSSKENRKFVSNAHAELVAAIAIRDTDLALSIHTGMLSNATQAYMEAAETED
ncbi:MAG: GntR family transcriptional regulator [Gammaproteobacteria bacterium]|jgi:DNA-binding GntR family transcriptional regulator|nr:GntR family transcriptional regulator [Gammaproteobacteria bacterium]